MTTEEQKREDILNLLDIVILMMMLVEKLESFQIESGFNKRQIKLETRKFLKLITPLAEQGYSIIFKNSQEGTNDTIREYENFIAQIRDLKMPNKIILSRILLALELDPKTIEATTHRILKKTK